METCFELPKFSLQPAPALEISPKDRLKGEGERGIVLSPLLCHPLHYQPLLPHPVLTTPPPGGDPGLGLGPLDGGRLGIVWQPADSGQHSGLINCHPGSLLVQCELRRAVGWLQQSIPSTSFSSSPPPVTEFKFDIRQQRKGGEHRLLRCSLLLVIWEGAGISFYSAQSLLAGPSL